MQKELESVEESVVSFTSQRLRVRRNKLSSNTRLAQDVGMDGDDAVEFFEDFSKKFNVDLHDLYSNWNRHFVPEPTVPSLALMSLMAGCVLLGYIVHGWLSVMPAWLWGLGFIGISLLVWRRWFTEEDTHDPVTIGDLVEAALLGRWSKHYPEDSLRNW